MVQLSPGKCPGFRIPLSTAISPQPHTQAPKKGLVSTVCVCTDTPLFREASKTTVIWSVFHDSAYRNTRVVTSQLKTMAVSSGKTVLGQAVSYALSKVGKPEMVLKNEQLTAMQLPLHCEGPTLTTSTYMRWGFNRFPSMRQEISVPNGLEDQHVLLPQ